METEDDLFLEIVEGVTLTVLARIGDDRAARCQFFKRLVELAREVATAGWGEPALGYQRRQLPR